MQIYTVQAGDSLYTIANAFGVDIEDIITINELPNPGQLSIGQTLLIPIQGGYHYVQPGESLYSISMKYNVPVETLARINGIPNPNQLPVGVPIYIPQQPKERVDIGAYLDPDITGQRSVETVNEIGENLTYLNLFSYKMNRDGTLTPLFGDEPIINAAYEDNVVPLMVITNIEEGQFSTELATTILSDPNLQDKLLDEAIQLMEAKGFLGIDFDLEYLGAENREPYNEFLRKASEKLKSEGRNYTISTALAPKNREDQIGVLYEGHDYEEQGKIVDFIFFMTYEWGWSGGPPRAVSPLNEVRKVMEYAMSVVPREKIMMGIPLYGYDWTLPYVKGGQFAKAISFQEAYALANQYQVEIKYDNEAQAPYFNYIDEDGKVHEVWFDDARSIQAKMDLVKELDLKGFFYWVLGREAPQNWVLLQENFIPNKRIM